MFFSSFVAPAIFLACSLSPSRSLLRRSIFHVSSADFEKQKETARSLIVPVETSLSVNK